jgi:hypothetical protein
MRRRSQSFYAKTEEEFKEQISEEIERPRKRSRISDIIEDTLDDTEEFEKVQKKKSTVLDHDDHLGVADTFYMEESSHTMEDEEGILMNSLHNISQSIKNRDRQSFLENISTIYLAQKAFNLNQTVSSPLSGKLCRSFSLDSINILDFDHIYPMTVANTNDLLINPILNDPIVSQNIKLTDEVLKVVLLGDDCIGKTLFADKLFNPDNRGGVYIHSKSLEIKKKRVRLLDRIVTLEFWDTNKDIQNSKLCESKIPFNVFSLYKIM